MKKRRVWRYTCEHCKKSNCSAPSIASHERHCTANPARHCRMCVKLQGVQQPIEILKAALANDCVENVDAEKNEVEPKHLREVADGCPCCMLAAIRQGRSMLPTFQYPVYTNTDRDEPTGRSEPWAYAVKFDFKAEMKTGIANINAAKNEDVGYSYVP
jgi:hypothetical protein